MDKIMCIKEGMECEYMSDDLCCFPCAIKLQMQLAALRTLNVWLHSELERVKRCYESATGKPVCGEGDIVRLECKEMTGLRERLGKAESLLRAIRLSSCPCGLGHDKEINDFFASTSPASCRVDALGRM